MKKLCLFLLTLAAACGGAPEAVEPKPSGESNPTAEATTPPAALDEASELFSGSQDDYPGYAYSARDSEEKEFVVIAKKNTISYTSDYAGADFIFKKRGGVYVLVKVDAWDQPPPDNP